MPRVRLSPAAYRWVTLGALLALLFIVVTGGAVRLTRSGLGCPDWPTCADGQLVPEWEYHKMVEFVNRAITGLVSLAVIVAVLGSRVRVPRRRDLVLLSAGLVAGVAGQIVLGGLTVLFELKPQFVMAHFLLSMVLLANAVVLHHRAGQPDEPLTAGGPSPSPAPPATPARPPAPPVNQLIVNLARAVVIAAGVAVFLGTIVTATGPHGGDEKAERFGFELPDVARLHGIAVVVFLVLTLVTLNRLIRDRAPAEIVRKAELVLGVSVAQSVVGYVQYFTGVPAVLVGVHIAGAASVWVMALRFLLAVSSPPAAAYGDTQDTGRPELLARQ